MNSSSPVTHRFNPYESSLRVTSWQNSVTSSEFTLNETEIIATKVALFCLESCFETDFHRQIPPSPTFSSPLTHSTEIDGSKARGKNMKMVFSSSLGLLPLKQEQFEATDNVALIDQPLIRFLSNSHSYVDRILPKIRNYFRVLIEEGKMEAGDDLEKGDEVAKTAAITAVCNHLTLYPLFSSSQDFSGAVAACKKLCNDLMSKESKNSERGDQITYICRVIGALQREAAKKQPRTLIATITELATDMTSCECIEQIREYDDFFRSFKLTT